MLNLWGSWLSFLTSAIGYEIFGIIVHCISIYFSQGHLGPHDYCRMRNGPLPDRHTCKWIWGCPIARVQLLSWVSYNTQHDMPIIIYTCIAIHSFIQESISDIPNVVITYSLVPNVFEEKWLLLSKSCRSKTGIANKHHKEATFNTSCLSWIRHMPQYVLVYKFTNYVLCIPTKSSSKWQE